MGKIIYGTERPDEIGPAGDPITEIAATEGGDVIYGNEGADNICGLGGNDKIYGGSDADQIDGGSGNDRMYGDAVNNDGSSREFVSGFDEGNDQMRGRDGNDLMFGNGGNDTMWGEEGNDTLAGGRGHDDIFGGVGNDVIYTGSGSDVADGGEGNDIIRGQRGHDHLDGDNGDDMLFGGAGRDSLRGAEGNDTLNGGRGNDLLDGGAGADLMSGGAANDQMTGGEGNDAMSGDDGDDQMRGDNGNDTMSGGHGSDRLDGGAGFDVLDGGYGADTLIGSSGSDILTGGGAVRPKKVEEEPSSDDKGDYNKYADTFVWKQGENAGDIDVITDWQHGDTIVLCGQLDFRVTKIVFENADPSTSYREDDVRIFLSDGGQILVKDARWDFESGLDNPLTPWGLEKELYGNHDDFDRVSVATPGQFSHPACNVFTPEVAAIEEPTPFDLWPQDDNGGTA